MTSANEAGTHGVALKERNPSRWYSNDTHAGRWAKRQQWQDSFLSDVVGRIKAGDRTVAKRGDLRERNPTDRWQYRVRKHRRPHRRRQAHHRLCAAQRPSGRQRGARGTKLASGQAHRRGGAGRGHAPGAIRSQGSANAGQRADGNVRKGLHKNELVPVRSVLPDVPGDCPRSKWTISRSSHLDTLSGTPACAKRRSPCVVRAGSRQPGLERQAALPKHFQPVLRTHAVEWCRAEPKRGPRLWRFGEGREARVREEPHGHGVPWIASRPSHPRV